MARMNLYGKVALVTGGAGGIGFETCRLLRERGAQVVVIDLDQARAEEAAARLGPGAFGIGADVTDLEAMKAAVRTAVDRWGSVDICVANAGIPSPIASVSSIEPAAFDRVIEINVLGVWRTVKAALPEVIAAKGHFVVVSSIYAFMPGMLAASYGASKAAAESFGRSLRIELASAGVTTTVARFGFVKTATFEDVLADPLAVRFENLVPKALRGRLTPEQAAAAIVAGIERRSPSVIAPGFWRSWSALRGVLNPVGDAAFARDRRLHAIVRDVENKGTTADELTQRRQGSHRG